MDIESLEVGKWMKKGLGLAKDSVRIARPLNYREEWDIKRIKGYLKGEELKYVTKLLRKKKVSVDYQTVSFSFLISGRNLIPKLKLSEDWSDKEINAINNRVRSRFFTQRFREFAERVWGVIPQFVAPHTVGMAELKKAITLQLFSTYPTHILITGADKRLKEIFLNSVNELSPISRVIDNPSKDLLFSDRAGKQYRGSFLQANDGVLCIDNFHKTPKSIQASLVDAMTSAKVLNAKKEEIVANVNVLASVPKRMRTKLGDSFHLSYEVKQDSTKSFAVLTDELLLKEKIINPSDFEFIRKYIEKARQIDVKLPGFFIKNIKDFVTKLKKNEKKLNYKVTPNTVKVIVELCKASARMELRKDVNANDLARIFELFDLKK